MKAFRCVAVLAAVWMVLVISGCSSTGGARPSAPAGYELDTTPGDDGEGYR